MVPGNDETSSLEDPRLAGGEWLFRRGGEVYGPVESRRIAELLYRGEIDAGTPVSRDDGEHWSLVGEVQIFVVHTRKAEARLRVEREVTHVRALEEKRRRRRTVALVAVAVVAVAGAGGGAWIATRPAPTSGLLEDFGEGIRITSAARVGVSRRAATAEDEIEIAIDPAPSGAAPAQPARRVAQGPRPAAAKAVRAPAGTASGDELAIEEARFDAGAIQAAVARQQRTLVPCFREQAARDPEYRGQVPLEFTIGNDGRVAALWIDEPRFRQGALRDCVQRTLAAWRFDPFPGQRPTVQLAFGVGR
jgi:hypothetical protein